MQSGEHGHNNRSGAHYKNDEPLCREDNHYEKRRPRDGGMLLQMRTAEKKTRPEREAISNPYTGDMWSYFLR